MTPRQAWPSEIAPIHISDNGRYFTDKTGTPFFWLGDTLWHLYRSFSPEDAAELLRDRKAKGFSIIQVMLIGYEGEPVANLHGERPWIDNDPARPNEAYYRHVDAVLRIACELDFVQVLGVYHKSQGRYYSEHSARESARWIAARYRDVPQIIWSMYPEAKKQYLPICRAMAEGLREGDGGSHLVTVHPDPSPQSSSFLHEEPWLAFNTLQTWDEIEQVYPMTASDYGRTPVKPAVMGEGGYETAAAVQLVTAADIRRQAYWTFLAGGHHVYGHDGNWRAPNQWRQWMAAPGTAHLSTYRRIVTSLPRWWDIVPDQSILAKGAGSGRQLNAAGRSAAGDWAAVYLSSPCTASVRMDRVKASETIEACWINPLNGTRTKIGRFTYAQTEHFTTPPGSDDALLLLEAQGSSA